MSARVTAFIFLILLVDGAAPQTEQEIANLSYGSCPAAYEDQIRSRFHTAAVEGAPIIWPPRKYWTKQPSVLDGRLVAGYLVAATVDEVPAPARSAERRVYGFLFKNGELIATISPAEMPLSPIAEDVGPTPRDERQWNIVYRRTSPNKYDVAQLIQWEPANEAPDNPAERVSHLVTGNIGFRSGPPSRLMERDMNMHRKGCANAIQNVLSRTPTEVLFERISTSCGQAKVDRYLIEKIVEGVWTMTSVSYQRKSRPTETEREKWIRLVGDAKLTVPNECKQRQP